MTPSQIVKALPSLIERRRPAMLWASPGVGKTDVVNQVANAMNRRVVDFRLAMRDPTALMGFPMPNHETKQMHFYRDTELPTSGTGILFLDEINSAMPATQAAGMQLTLTGKIGDYTLPPDWSIIAAGNRESDRSVVHRMPSALSMRLTHIDFDVNLDDWTDWAISHGIHSDVISFIRFRPNLLSEFNPSARSSPSPRSWQFVDEIYKDQLDKNIELELVSGTVGQGAASEFIGFIDQIRDLPTVEQILMNPDKVELPTSPATQIALVTGLALHANEDNADRMMGFINRMETEMQVVFVRDAARREQAIFNTKSIRDWSIKNSHVLSST